MEKNVIRYLAGANGQALPAMDLAWITYWQLGTNVTLDMYANAPLKARQDFAYTPFRQAWGQFLPDEFARRLKNADGRTMIVFPSGLLTGCTEKQFYDLLDSLGDEEGFIAPDTLDVSIGFVTSYVSAITGMPCSDRFSHAEAWVTSRTTSWTAFISALSDNYWNTVSLLKRKSSYAQDCTS